jgi:hypothetical protein
MNIHPTTAIFPGANFFSAVHRTQHVVPKFFGVASDACSWSMDVVHLCPQTREPLDDEIADRLMEQWPGTQFQLHANVPMEHRNRPFDASLPWDDPQTKEYVAWLKARCQQMSAKRYSWHASGGMRTNTLQQAIDNTHRLEDALGLTVALEGLYTNTYGWALSTKEEYLSLLEGRVSYALDLSHLHIVHCQESRFKSEEISELLRSKCCQEVHVSHNDGLRDAHEAYPKNVSPFGLKELLQVACERPHLEVFSESRFE